MSPVWEFIENNPRSFPDENPYDTLDVTSVTFAETVILPPILEIVAGPMVGFVMRGPAVKVTCAVPVIGPLVAVTTYGPAVVPAVNTPPDEVIVPPPLTLQTTVG